MSNRSVTNRSADDASQPAAPRTWVLPAAIALLTWLSLLLTLDPAGSSPALPSGPGLTLDEWFNYSQGDLLIDLAKHYGIALLHPGSFYDIFSNEAYNPDHPPLGRVLIGIGQQCASVFVTRDDSSSPFSAAGARTAPAAVFALTVLLVGWYTARRNGRIAGAAAAAGVALMPRLYGHAHLASLESFIGLTCSAVVLYVAATWLGESAPTRRQAMIAGLLFGLAMLTKIQAVFLPVPVVAWTVLRWRKRAAVPLAIAAGTALVVFYVGWPWLWSDLWGHTREYLSRSTVRVSLKVWYLGTPYTDRSVPWHYPLVMFATTIPIGLLLLGAMGVRTGLATGCADRCRNGFLLTWIVVPLVVFAVPAVAVYDGARLFLVAFPVWGVFVGTGADAVLRWLRARISPRAATALVSGVFVLQGIGLVLYAPCFLSYYNAAVGGLRGADALGFERTYWGDSVTRHLLRETAQSIPKGSRVSVAPMLHQFQLLALTEQSPIIREHELQLLPFGEHSAPARYVLVFHRLADLPDELRKLETRVEPIAEVRRQGVLLAALYDLGPPHAPLRPR